MLYVLAQVFFGLCVAIFALTWLQKKKSKMLLLYMTSDIFLCLHYVCMEKFSATIFVANEALLILIIYFLERFDKLKFKPLASGLIILADVIACALMWVDAWALFPLFATTLAIIGMSIKKIVPAKIVAFFAVCLTTTYMFIIHSWFSASVELLMVCVAFAGIIISIVESKKQHKLTKENNIQKEMVKNKK